MKDTTGVGTADAYRRFARLEAAGRSPHYETLALAVAAARRRPPVVHRGDLLDDLARVAADAPPDSTLVVYHSAVLAYVGEKKRRAFADAVAELGAVWLSNEGDGVLRCIGVGGSNTGSFALVRDGREILAWADPHATRIKWRGTRPTSP